MPVMMHTSFLTPQRHLSCIRCRVMLYRRTEQYRRGNARCSSLSTVAVAASSPSRRVSSKTTSEATSVTEGLALFAHHPCCCNHDLPQQGHPRFLRRFLHTGRCATTYLPLLTDDGARRSSLRYIQHTRSLHYLRCLFTPILRRVVSCVNEGECELFVQHLSIPSTAGLFRPHPPVVCTGGPIPNPRGTVSFPNPRGTVSEPCGRRESARRSCRFEPAGGRRVCYRDRSGRETRSVSVANIVLESAVAAAARRCC